MGQNPLGFWARNISGTAFTGGKTDASGALWDSARHPVNYAAAYNGAIGMVSNASGVTTSAALATTYVGLCLSNPAASGKNLVLINVSGLFNVVPAAFTMLNLITGFSSAGVVTHTTALTVLSSIVGGSAAGLVGLADSACTIVGTPAWSAVLSETNTATTSTSFSKDFNGAILIPPGGYAAIGTSIASPASGFWGSMVWGEEPV